MTRASNDPLTEARREWRHRALAGYAPTSHLGLSQSPVAMVIRNLIDQVQAAAADNDDEVVEAVIEQTFRHYRRLYA